MQETANKMQDTGCQIQDKKHKTWGIMHRASCIGHHGNKGFTMIELVITMVLIGIVAYIAADAMSTGFKAFFVTDNRKEALDQARIAMERMTREIRNVRSSSDIGTVNGTEFCFINIDGTRIDFRYEGTDIRRLENGAACPGVAGSGNILSSDITSFRFRNPDGSDLSLAMLTTTKRVVIVITSTVRGEIVQLQSEVWPRNL